jgi:hypothetical protein
MQGRRIAALEEQLLARRHPPTKTTRLSTPPRPQGKRKARHAEQLRRLPTTKAREKPTRKRRR